MSAKLNLKMGKKRILALILIFASLFYATTFLSASARSEDNSNLSPGSLIASSPDSDEGSPNLIRTLDNSTTPTDDGQMLIETRENPATANDNSTLDNTQGSELNDNPVLISTQSQPDYAPAIVGVSAILAAAAVVLMVFAMRRRKIFS